MSVSFKAGQRSKKLDIFIDEDEQQEQSPAE